MSAQADSPPPALDDRQFELAVRKLADALRYGSDASPFLGAGLDYAQSRTYLPGDPVKSIDWRLTARSGKPHVKQYEAPKQMPTWLIVDDSGSMGAGGLPRRGPTKWQWAILLAGALGLAALRRMSPVGLVTSHGERFEPSLSRVRLHAWLQPMRRRQAHGASSLGQHVRDLFPTLAQRSNLIVLSDLHDTHLIDTLTVAAERHDVVVLRLEDPAERGGTGGGIYRAQEAETGQGFIATGWSRFPRDEAPGRMNRAGIRHLTLPTDGAWIPLLREFLARRGTINGGRR